MTALIPLQGIELIDCAQANARQGIAVAAQQCGYADDIATFEQELQIATKQIGVKIHGFQDLIKIAEAGREGGIEIAPESDTRL